MHRFIPMTLLIAGLFAGAVCQANVGGDGEHVRPVDATRHAIDIANNFLKNNDVTDAAGALDGAINSAGFTDLSDDEKYRVLSFSGNLAIERGDDATAHRWLIEATGFAQANGVDWHRRLNAAFDLADYADSAHCIAVIVRRWPRSMDQINNVAIYRIEAHLRHDPALGTANLEMLDGLFDAAWSDDEVQPARFWVDLAQLLLERHQSRRAATVAARIDSPRVAVDLLVDKRFDALTRGKERDFDVDRIATANIARLQARSDRSKDRLQPLIDLQYALLDKCKFARALAISDAVIARVADVDGATVYTDFVDHYIWILDDRSRALQGLGRWDDAVAQQRKAARRPEGGQMNVSQSLNLGQLYADLDRPDDALDAVSELGSMSPYGRMQLERIRLTVALERGDAKAVGSHVAYLREHRADAIETYETALLATNRLDEASDLLIERLRNDSWRRAAVAAMQDYAAIARSPRQQQVETHLRAVIARPQVQRALDKVGRIIAVHLAPPSH
ncbi:MAG TPA: hypothetical protein VFG55_03535 [Rhodanobacteraceae bacterium]|nr:hypothetical protein [Rhodanobacteraceae bacterium]